MANASERNRRALARLIRERELKRERDVARKARRTIKDPKASRGQKYRARQKLAAMERVSAGIISEAEQWPAYRLNYPNPLTRTKGNAQAFIDGFGSRGASGTTNRHGGFHAASWQVTARDRYIKMTAREARRLSTGVKDFSAGWWTVWREDYSAAFGGFR